MNYKNFFIVLYAILIGAILIFSGCRKKETAEKVVITVKGSDTMVNLSQKWAEVYMGKNDNVSIQVTGGGSGTGIAALFNKTTDLANSSRAIKEDELETAKQKGVPPVQHEAALDGIAVIVHPGNKVDKLTIQQVSDIFTGKIT